MSLGRRLPADVDFSSFQFNPATGNFCKIANPERLLTF